MGQVEVTLPTHDGPIIVLRESKYVLNMTEDMKTNKKVALIHTTAVVIDPMMSLLKSMLPEVTVINLVVRENKWWASSKTEILR